MSGRKAAKGAKRQGTISAGRIAARVADLGRAITRAYQGRRVDVVVMMDRGFVFAADLIRHVDAPVVCHFVQEDVRDVEHGGHPRREVAFGKAPEVKGRDVLVVDAVLDSGGCFWTSRSSVESRWSPITLGSGLHLMVYG